MSKRVSYFDRQFLRAEDFRLEQGYHIGRRRGMSAGMFRPGVATGLEVVRVDAASVRVTAGLAIDGRGREIVLDQDSGAFPVDPAAAVEIWIAYAEAPSEPVSYLGADEPRFARIDEAPAIVPVPPGSVPADGIRLAMVPPGGDPDMSPRPVAGPRHGSVTAQSLADAAVTSRALAEADGGASGQDTASGSGVKSGHIQDGAVTSDKLADDVVDGLAERTVAKLLETGVPIADGSVIPDLLADDAVSSRALAEAVPGSTDQDTSSGTGVKTGHLTDKAVTGPKLADAAVTAPKLADGAVTLDKLATKLVFNRVVRLPPAASPDRPGTLAVFFETVPLEERAFYLVSVSFLDPADRTVRWTHITVENEDANQQNGVMIENFQQLSTVDVRCVALRLG